MPTTFSGDSSVRGLVKARGEWDPACLALNVKRLLPLLAA